MLDPAHDLINATADKPHRGIIYGTKMHVLGGEILVGLYEHPEKGRLVLRFTSLIVHENGQEYETLNSRYRLHVGEFPPEVLKTIQGYLNTSL